MSRARSEAAALFRGSGGSWYDDQYVCAYCERHFVIPDFARDCEDMHEAIRDTP